MKRFLLIVIFLNIYANIQGQINGITSHIWFLEEVDDNGVIYQYDDPSTVSTYLGSMDIWNGFTLSAGYCSSFDVNVTQSGNRAFTTTSNFTMRNSACDTQAEQQKNDAYINAFVNATRTNGVATFSYRFEDVFYRLIITTPDNVLSTWCVGASCLEGSGGGVSLSRKRAKLPTNLRL